MRIGMVLGIALLLSGCAHKREAELPSGLTIPKECIVGGVLNKTRCQTLNETEALCDAVVVKFACVKATKSK